MSAIVYEREKPWIMPETLDGQVPACMLWKIPSRYVLRKRWWQRLVSWQRGRCALCGDKGFGHVLDHCHTSGLVRGFICQSCNRLEATSDGERFVRWDAGWHAAAMLGIEEEYFSPITGHLVLNWQGLRLRMTDEQRAAFDRDEPVELDIFVDVLNEARWPPDRIYRAVTA